MKPFKLNQRGMTLVEVMMSVGIMATVSAGIASLISYSLSATKHVEQKNEQLDFDRSVDLAIMDRRLCGLAIRDGLAAGQNSFTTHNFAPKDLTRIRICEPNSPYTNCSPIYDPTAATPVLPKSGIRFSTLNITIPQLGALNLGTVSLIAPGWSATPGVTQNYRRYLAELNIATEKENPKASLGAASFQTIRKKIVLLVNPSNNQVDLCEGVQTTNEEACTNLFGGTFDATKNPGCRVSNLTSHPSLWPSDVSNRNLYSFLSNEPAGAGGNLGVMGGTNPGITFGQMTGSAAAPPLDSGSANLYYDVASRRLNIRSPHSGAAGSIEINSKSGNIRLAQNNTVAMDIAGGQVHVHRPMYANAGIYGTVMPPSDRRLKSDIQPHTNALEKILKLKGANFRYNSNPSEIESGYIAQEVQKVIPEVVKKSPNGFFAVNYSAIVSYITDAIKELVDVFNERFDQQDRRIFELEKQIELLKHELREQKVRCELVE